MFFSSGTTEWITPEDGIQSGNPAGRVMLFRRRFQGKGKLRVAVSADSEYRLFCNGREAAQGPALRDNEETFFDTCDLTAFLQEGENEILAEVVGFATAFPDFYRGGCPMARMAVRDAFILEGCLQREDGSRENISTGEKWEAAEAPDLFLFRCPGVPAAGPGEQYITGKRTDALFSPAQKIEPGFRPDNVKNTILPYRLVPRRIPDLKRQQCVFADFFDLQGASPDAMQAMLQGAPLTVRPHEKADFTLDFTRETTGRLLVSILQGTGTIEFFYAENLQKGDERHFSPQQDHSPLTGPMKDRLILTGEACDWKSFFYRAFRFVRAVITAGDTAISLKWNTVEQENYPYEWNGTFSSNIPVYNRMRDMGLRTLQLCSHHILEDCPYYERLQYAADSRIAAQIAYMTAGDSRLPEQAICHFRHSIQAQGLSAGSYPSRSPVILPLWSLHFIMMVQECHLYTGKEEILRENLPAARRILEWFLSHRLPGGGIGKLPYWDMADFSAQWLWFGEPPKISKEPSSYVTFFVMECLHAYRCMAGFLGKASEASWALGAYHALAEDCRIFYDEQKGFFADTPDKDSFSLLANAEAVLAKIPRAEEMLLRAYRQKDIALPSPFGNTFVFLAFLRSGSRECAHQALDSWKSMLADGRTVFPEGTPVPRSECHVWSAFSAIAPLLLYTGFQIEQPGGKAVSFSPWEKQDAMLEGTIPLPAGVIHFQYQNGKCDFSLPKGICSGLQNGFEETCEHR